MNEVLVLALSIVLAFVLGVVFATKFHEQILAKKDAIAADWQNLAAKAHAERDAIFARFAPSHAAPPVPAAIPAVPVTPIQPTVVATPGVNS